MNAYELAEYIMEGDSLARLDILRDWIGTLQKEYDATYIEWTTESALLKMRKSGAI